MYTAHCHPRFFGNHNIEKNNMKRAKIFYWNHSKACKDHLEKSYPSLSELASAYGLTVACLSRRLNIYHFPLEQALTTPCTNSPISIYDHKGNWFKSISELAEHYHIERKTLTYRLNNGWYVEKALTTPSRIKTKEQP